MKKILFSIIILLSFTTLKAQSNFEALSLSNQFPQVNQILSFQYNQNLSPLIKEKVLEIIVYQFTNNGYVVKEPIITKKDSIYSATIKLDSNATCLAFGFLGEKDKDNNKGNGYIVPIYNKAKEPVIGYYASAGGIYLGYGETLFGMQNNPQKRLELAEESIIKYPELENDYSYFYNYFEALKRVKKPESEKIISEIIKKLEGKENLNEGIYLFLYYNYLGENNKTKSDSIGNLMAIKYPKNRSIKENNLVNDFLKEINAEKKVIIYQNYRAFNSNKDWEGSPINMMKEQITLAYDRENNILMYEKWFKELTLSKKASVLNVKAWELAEKGEKLQEAKKMSKLATAYAKNEYQNPTEKKPSSKTNKQWKQEKDNNYASYADTYAFILYRLGQYKEGLEYAKIAATTNKLGNIDYNERYVLLLQKQVHPETTKVIIEKMIIENAASEKTKAILKVLYQKIKKSNSGYDEYLKKLELAPKELRKASLDKLIINVPSPKFALKDWEGKEVTLESLDGKIVVVDFWATWCGPCIASMPGMKLAQEKYATRDDIKFIFIDTWEKGDNKNEKAKEFIQNKNYPFYVLMDNENKMVQDFEVRGIPTKFIIDKAGNIRFKFVGYSGTPQNVLDEISIMIEIIEQKQN